MKIAICDDDLMIRQQLTKYITEYFKREKLPLVAIVSFSSGEELLDSKELFDIIFLDIEMTGINGIFVGQEMKKKNSKLIVFVVTSFAEYLDEAMRFQVFRYLSKPIDKDRLYRNLKDALILYANSSKIIAIETKRGVKTVDSYDIICVEARERRIWIHTVFGLYESIHNMNYWLENLPKQCFFQTHRSYLVNMHHVTDFDMSTVHLYHGQVLAYLTRRKYTQFKEAFLLFLESTN